MNGADKRRLSRSSQSKRSRSATQTDTRINRAS